MNRMIQKVLWAWAVLLAVGSAARAELPTWTVAVGDLKRTALVYAPANAERVAVPVVFVFHGHGGSAERAHKQFAVDSRWPEAISVYMQGVPTPIGADTEGTRAGWQIRPGTFGDRDLHFFDAVLAKVKQTYRVDEKRIYSTGMSNGGYFTYLLWQTRPEVFAAYGPASASTYGTTFKPAPAIIQGGDADLIVPSERQARTMQDVRRGNHCAEDTFHQWDLAGDVGGNDKPKLYPSTPEGTPIVTWVFHGGHKFMPVEAEQIVAFFRTH